MELFDHQIISTKFQLHDVGDCDGNLDDDDAGDDDDDDGDDEWGVMSKELMNEILLSQYIKRVPFICI